MGSKLGIRIIKDNNNLARRLKHVDSSCWENNILKLTMIRRKLVQTRPGATNTVKKNTQVKITKIKETTPMPCQAKGTYMLNARYDYTSAPPNPLKSVTPPPNLILSNQMARKTLEVASADTRSSWHESSHRARRWVASTPR